MGKGEERHEKELRKVKKGKRKKIVKRGKYRGKKREKRKETHGME